MVLRVLSGIAVAMALWHVTVRVSVGGEGARDSEGLGVTGPPLTALGSKLASGDWLVGWLVKPSRLRPGTAMPDFALTAAEAQAMAAYLYAEQGREHPRSHAPRAAWRGGDARTGGALFVTRGCAGCHAAAPEETSVAPRVPNLAGIGLKVRGDWLFDWIRAPRAYDPHTAMPRLVLGDADVRHLVAFLLTRRDGAAALADAPRFDPAADRAAGRRLVERYQCAECHALPGAPPPAPPFVLVAAEGGHGRARALRNGRVLVAHYNCRGCHRIEGSGGAIAARLERKTFAPPRLDGEGARVQFSWLVDFLERPRSLRPWMQMQMPDYGLPHAHAVTFAEYFAALAGIPATDEPALVASTETIARGLRRFAHFKCVQCHPTSTGPELPAGVDPEDLTINLTLAKTRLRPSWVGAFLARPKAIVGTKTRMPAVFYTSDGIPKVEQPERDIEAITAYLMHMTEPPETALARLEAARRAEEAPPTDWRTYEY